MVSHQQKLEERELSEEQGTGHTCSPTATQFVVLHATFPGSQPHCLARSPSRRARGGALLHPATLPEGRQRIGLCATASVLAEDESRHPLCPLTCSYHPPRARPPRLHCR